jgi:hypothetical protein
MDYDQLDITTDAQGNQKGGPDTDEMKVFLQEIRQKQKEYEDALRAEQERLEAERLAALRANEETESQRAARLERERLQREQDEEERLRREAEEREKRRLAAIKAEQDARLRAQLLDMDKIE